MVLVTLCKLHRYWTVEFSWQIIGISVVGIDGMSFVAMSEYKIALQFYYMYYTNIVNLVCSLLIRCIICVSNRTISVCAN